MRIPLGPWRPDADPFSGQGLVDVRNAIPARGHWRPQPGLLAATEHTVTPPIQGMMVATRLSGDVELFIAFEGAIYRVPSRSADLIEVTSSSNSTHFSTTAGMRWRYVQYGDLLIATDFYDEIQCYDLNLGGHFVPLASAAPKARYIAVVRDFVVVGDTSTVAEGRDAYRVQWHGFVDGLPDPTEWDLSHSATTQADFQRLADIGQINGLTGGEFGTIVGESGVSRMSYGAALFQFDTVERRIGTRTPNSVNQYRQITAWWSPEGWAAFDGSGVRMIGVEKVDRWFAEDFDETQKDLMWSAVDSKTGHMLWAYCGNGHQGKPNRLLRYSPALDEWSASDIEMDCLAPGKTFAATLDDAMFNNLDAFTGNLDDPALWASLPSLLSVSATKISGFQGTAMTARFETAEFQIGGDERRSLFNRSMVIRDGGDVSLNIYRREKFSQPGSWSSAHTERSDGWCRFREPGRSHRARISLSGSWTAATALDVFGTPVGSR